MASSRGIFIVITLFLAMLMTISSAPVVHDQLVTSEPESKVVDDVATKMNEIKHTTDVPDVITDKLLFFDVTAMPMDENIKTGNTLLFEKTGDTPQYPPTEGPRSFQMDAPGDSVTTQN
jgi:methionine-rich copper-binding protein CopC